MAQIIDISRKITNQLPVVKITEELVVTVNNRKSTVLNIQAMMEEAEKKGKDNDVTFVTKALEMLVGKKNAEEIEKMDLPLNEYMMVYETIMNVAIGEYGETPS